ncbi:MAG TPA: hypothetical protein VGP36_07950 [Mycobacteriales bacterium]|jgi:hypothetical protein|nr:hypothetical protein [Mycobacteriales bacterium]
MTSTMEPAIAAPVTPANTVLSDLVDAIETYPTTYLTVEIFDVDPPGTGTGINEAEDITCKVRVHNSGPLNVLQLRLLVTGEAGSDGVRFHDDTAFSPSLFSTPIELVPAHMQDGDWVETPEHYHFKAGAVSGGRVDLVGVSVDTWNADLEHPLTAHSDPDPSVGDTLSKSVLRA